MGQRAGGDGSAAGQGGDEDQRANHHRGPAPAAGVVRLVIEWYERLRLRFGVWLGGGDGIGASIGHEVVLGPSAA